MLQKKKWADKAESRRGVERIGFYPGPFWSKNSFYFWNFLHRNLLPPFLVDGWRGVGRAGEPLILSTYTHNIVFGSERPTLNAYPCQIMLVQCREIVDTANAMDGSVSAWYLHGGCMSVCSGGTDLVAHPPPLMQKLGRGPTCLLYTSPSPRD